MTTRVVMDTACYLLDFQAKAMTAQAVDKGEIDYDFHLESKVDYAGKPHEEITFRLEPANPSISTDEFTTFIWYVNDSFPIVTNKPVATHTYDEEYNDLLYVTALRNDGKMIYFEDATITISNDLPSGDRSLSIPRNLKTVRTGDNELTTSWDGSENFSLWGLVLNDTPMQLIEPKQNSLVLRDYDFSHDSRVGIAGITAEGRVGPTSYVSVAREVADGKISPAPDAPVSSSLHINNSANPRSISIATSTVARTTKEISKTISPAVAVNEGDSILQSASTQPERTTINKASNDGKTAKSVDFNWALIILAMIVVFAAIVIGRLAYRFKHA